MSKAIVLSVLAFLLTSTVGSKDWTPRKIRVKATAYCTCSICCGKWSEHKKTAFGRDATKPGVAVDPRIIRKLSPLTVPGYTRDDTDGSWVVADDTGRLIKGNRIDLRFKSHQRAVNFGVKWLTITVWE